jgi:predicted TIM-barrel fold metal-dependent hydrolase
VIIDTHFHALPGKYLDLVPEAQNDVRGVGFHAFDHREYLDVMDKYGIDIGVLTVGADRILFGSDYPHGRGGRDDHFYPMTLAAIGVLDIPKADKEKIYYRNAEALFGFVKEA